MGSYFSRRSEQKTIIVSPAVTKSVVQDVSEPTGTVEHVAPVVRGKTGTVEYVEPVASGPTGTVEHVVEIVTGDTGTVEHVVPIATGDTGTVEPITKEEIVTAFITPLAKLVEVPEASNENVVSAKRHKKNHKKY